MRKEKNWHKNMVCQSLIFNSAAVPKYLTVFVNGVVPVNLFPLTPTLSPIGGEGIKQDSYCFLSPWGERKNADYLGLSLFFPVQTAFKEI
jgi:hypothetical protein